jgi:hypothetical protein
LEVLQTVRMIERPGGKWVEKSKPKRGDLIVTVNFEPNRLEEENLGVAYELLLPIGERVSRSRKIQTRKLEASKDDQLGIFSLAVSH